MHRSRGLGQALQVNILCGDDMHMATYDTDCLQFVQHVPRVSGIRQQEIEKASHNDLLAGNCPWSHIGFSFGTRVRQSGDTPCLPLAAEQFFHAVLSQVVFVADVAECRG